MERFGKDLLRIATLAYYFLTQHALQASPLPLLGQSPAPASVDALCPPTPRSAIYTD